MYAKTSPISNLLRLSLTGTRKKEPARTPRQLEDKATRHGHKGQRENQRQSINLQGGLKPQVFSATSEDFWCGHAKSLAPADVGFELLSSNRLDGIDGKMNKYTH